MLPNELDSGADGSDKKSEMRVLALYLPQFHEIAENSQWWGEGYTEWTSVRNAKPLWRGHIQPRRPLNGEYYDLSDRSGAGLKWQADMASAYGIYGFVIYHYWFKGKQLLERPMEILLAHPEIDIKYCICWANEPWTRTWYGLESKLLIDQEYGLQEDWIAHFNYLLKFFKDERYIKVDNKPLVNIYRSADIDDLESMLACWKARAIANGFSGLYVVASNNSKERETRVHLVDAFYNFEPGYSTRNDQGILESFRYFSGIALKSLLNRLTGLKILERRIDARRIWRKIVKNYRRNGPGGKITYPGLFPMWDNTPRRGYKGMAFTNASPKVFGKTLAALNDMIEAKDFIYINAWNEWGEGCYLEPDTATMYAYLEEIASCKGLGKIGEAGFGQMKDAGSNSETQGPR